MAQQKKGWVTRLLEGKEKSEEYARSTLPTNRWQLFWDIFKGNFGKIVKVNLLTLLFFVPMIAVIVLYLLMGQSESMLYPFGANMGVGYPSAPFQAGISEARTLSNGTFLYFGLILTSLVAAVGLSGGMYVVRNMVWTEGIFVTSDFWRGIKLNYKNAVQISLFFTIILFLCTSVINSAEMYIALGNLTDGATVWMRISQVVSYVFIALAALFSMWMISMSVNYQMKFLACLRNAFFLTVGTFPQTIFFLALAAIPFLLFLINGSFFIVLGVFAVLLFGLTYALLVWLNFSQWVFDKYINPKIAGAKTGRGLYNKDGTSATTGEESESTKAYQRAVLAYGKSKLVARPIKPIDDSLQVYELPGAFTREDLQRLKESKQHIAEDSAAYAEEHKNDLRYVEYNKQFEEREKALQDSDKGKKVRAKKPPKMLGE